MFGNLNKGRKSSEKIYFFKNIKILLKILILIILLFPIMSQIKPDATPGEKPINEDSFIGEIINQEKGIAVKYLMNILDIKIYHF